MNILEHNKVEAGAYVKPKWWAKEGERKVICRVHAGGSLVLTAELTDDSVIWFSRTDVHDVTVTAGILNILFDTTKEKNSEWHCTSIANLRTGVPIPYGTFENGVVYTFTMYADEVCDFEGEKRSWKSDQFGTCLALASQLLKLYQYDAARCENDERSPMLLEKLKDAEKQFDAAAAETNTQRLQMNYIKLHPLMKEIESMQYLMLSSEMDVTSRYKRACESAERLYNRNMSVSR